MVQKTDSDRRFNRALTSLFPSSCNLITMARPKRRNNKNYRQLRSTMPQHQTGMAPIPRTEDFSYHADASPFQPLNMFFNRSHNPRYTAIPEMAGEVSMRSEKSVKTGRPLITFGSDIRRLTILFLQAFPLIFQPTETTTIIVIIIYLLISKLKTTYDNNNIVMAEAQIHRLRLEQPSITVHIADWEAHLMCTTRM